MSKAGGRTPASPVFEPPPRGSRSNLVGHKDDPKPPKPLEKASISSYGDPQTTERIIAKLCEEFDFLPQLASTTLDTIIEMLHARCYGLKDRVDRGNVIHEFFAKAISEADIDAPSAFEILKVCLELAVFLMRKNKKYGDSALKPLRVMSKADPEELIKVRMDDKLNRMIQGSAGDDEDVAQDFVGYWVLLKVLQSSKQSCSNG